MAGLSVMALGILTLIVIYSIVPLVGDNIDQAITIPGAESGSGTVSFAGNAANKQTLNVSTETYQLVNGSNETVQAFEVDVSTGAGSASYNSSYVCSRFVAEVTANSTLITATTCTASNVTTLTAVSTGISTNYAVSTNITGATANSLTGGTDGSQWNSSTNTDLPTGPGTWTTLAPLLTLAAIVLVIGGFLGTLKGIRG